MNIWVDANGWPVPPIVLLGCLVAEILYFRGWRVLVKAEQSKKAARTTTPLHLAALMPVNFSGIAGSGAASTSSAQSLCSFWQLLLPLTYSPAALLGSYGPAPALTGRHGTTARGRCAAATVVAGIATPGAQALASHCKAESRACLLLDGTVGCGNPPSHARS